MEKYITKETVLKIIKEYAETPSVHDIARQNGCTMDVVRYHLKKRGVYHLKWDYDRAVLFLRKYNGGEPLYQIAEDFNIKVTSIAYIVKYLTNRYALPRERRRKWDEGRCMLFLRMYNSGLSKDALSSEFGIKPTSISSQLQEIKRKYPEYKLSRCKGTRMRKAIVRDTYEDY